MSGRSSMAEQKLPKLTTGVRFSSPAPTVANKCRSNVRHRHNLSTNVCLPKRACMCQSLLVSARELRLFVSRLSIVVFVGELFMVCTAIEQVYFREA